MDFAEAVKHLRDLRQTAGRSVEDVAGVAGIGPSALRNYEAGLRLPNLGALQRWAGALGWRILFDVRETAADSRAERIASRAAHLDESTGRMAERFIELAGEARPAQVRAALAALESLVSDAAESPAGLADPAHR